MIVPADRLIEVATWLRDDDTCAFDYLSDLTATDWPPGRALDDHCLYSTG